MKVLIDNLDGQGFVDTMPVIAEKCALRIERTLNAPSTCAFGVYLQSGVAAPIKRGRVVVIAENDVALFTGYVTSVTVQSEAADAWTHVVAVSDEVLADGAGMQSGLRVMQGSLAEQMQHVARRQGAGVVDASGVMSSQEISIAASKKNASFSVNAGWLAEAGYAAYRVLGGSLGVQAIGEVVHLPEEIVLAEWGIENACS